MYAAGGCTRRNTEARGAFWWGEEGIAFLLTRTEYLLLLNMSVKKPNMIFHAEGKIKRIVHLMPIKLQSCCSTRKMMFTFFV